MRSCATMEITRLRFYDGARAKVCRLGLADIFLEVQEILTATEIRWLEVPGANGSAAVREAIDAAFHAGSEPTLGHHRGDAHRAAEHE